MESAESMSVCVRESSRNYALQTMPEQAKWKKGMRKGVSVHEYKIERKR